MLYIVATPIGNLKDITVRAQEILRTCDHVICEDSRRTGRLLQRYGIKRPLISYYEANKKKRLPQIMDLLQQGKTLCLVSDAGTPCVSDPGFLIVRQCIRDNVGFTVVPGADAVIPALVLSGFPTTQFAFMGFLAHKSGKRKKMLETVAADPRTAVLYESPYRLVRLMRELKETVPGRLVCVVREMTKLNEEVVRGTVEEVEREFSGRQTVKGECVVVIAARDFSL